MCLDVRLVVKQPVVRVHRRAVVVIVARVLWRGAALQRESDEQVAPQSRASPLTRSPNTYGGGDGAPYRRESVSFSLSVVLSEYGSTGMRGYVCTGGKYSSCIPGGTWTGAGKGRRVYDGGRKLMGDGHERESKGEESERERAWRRAGHAVVLCTSAALLRTPARRKGWAAGCADLLILVPKLMDHRPRL